MGNKKSTAINGEIPCYTGIKTPEGYVSIHEECCPGMPIEIATKIFNDARPKFFKGKFPVILTGTKNNE